MRDRAKKLREICDVAGLAYGRGKAVFPHDVRARLIKHDAAMGRSFSLVAPDNISISSHSGIIPERRQF